MGRGLRPVVPCHGTGRSTRGPPGRYPRAVTLHVRIVGTGLIGTSLGIALSRAGHDVILEDPSPTAVALARDLGAGRLARRITPLPTSSSWQRPRTSPEPSSPRSCPVAGRRGHGCASVKVAVLEEIRAREGTSRYAGSHPMAGRERSGAVARGDLFDGRAWVVVPHAGVRERAVDLVRQMATDAGGTVSVMSPGEHDAASPRLACTPGRGKPGREPAAPASEGATASAGQGLRMSPG